MKSLTAYSTVLCIKEVITIRRKITFISYYISIYITCLPFFMHVLGKFSGYGSSFIQVSQERATESSTMEWVESSFLSLQSYGMAIQKSPSLHTWDYYCLPLLFSISLVCFYWRGEVYDDDEKASCIYKVLAELMYSHATGTSDDNDKEYFFLE